jgi:hypothetical protein
VIPVIENEIVALLQNDGISIDITAGEHVTILGVPYIHLGFPNRDDLYVTRFGAECIGNIMPSQYTGEAFRKYSRRLKGTSSVYQVRTEGARGNLLDVVLKWNRMAQDVPGSTGLIGEQREFNSPFEEFQLALELKECAENSAFGFEVQRPLAIYVPSEKAAVSEWGRAEWIMERIIRSHNNIQIDMERAYAVLYDWIEGIDAVMAKENGLLSEANIAELTLRAEHEMRVLGFEVADRKPHHIIVQVNGDHSLGKKEDNQVCYGVVDYELLHYTAEGERDFTRGRRKEYLTRQAERFTTKDLVFPPNLFPVNIMGVDYVYGHTESSGGAAWVVGRDPSLFDYFLPERWRRTPKTQISESQAMYHTVTKDNINLVWVYSNCGVAPNMDPYYQAEEKVLKHGYNSPFEEIALAMILNDRGILTTYPRAVYMTGHETNISKDIIDNSRFISHAGILTPDGYPTLREGRAYITIWGYFNGPDEMLAVEDGNYYTGITALHAYKRGLITMQLYAGLLDETRERLAQVGYEDINLRGSHIMLSFDKAGRLVGKGPDNPEVRVSNFEFIRKIDAPLACPLG